MLLYICLYVLFLWVFFTLDRGVLFSYCPIKLLWNCNQFGIPSPLNSNAFLQKKPQYNTKTTKISPLHHAKRCQVLTWSCQCFGKYLPTHFITEPLFWPGRTLGFGYFTERYSPLCFVSPLCNRLTLVVLNCLVNIEIYWPLNGKNITGSWNISSWKTRPAYPP